MKGNIAYYLRTYRFKSIYTRLIIVFSMVLTTAVLIVGGFSYIRASQSIKKKVNEANLQTLRQMQQVIDAALEKVDTITSNIAMHYLMRRDYNDLSLSEKLDLPDFISSQLSETYIDSIYVYYLQSGKVVSVPGGAVDISVLPDTEWFKAYENAVPLGFKTLTINHRTINRNNVKIDAITIIRDFPFLSTPKIGAIVININKAKLFRIIQQNILPTQSLLVLDENGELLNGDSNLFSNLYQEINFFNIIKEDSGYAQINVNDKLKMVSYIRSFRNGWIYVKIEDVSYLTAATKGIKSLTLWLMLICLGAGMIHLSHSQIFLCLNLRTFLFLDCMTYHPPLTTSIKLSSWSYSSIFSSNFSRKSLYLHINKSSDFKYSFNADETFENLLEYAIIEVLNIS